MPIAEPPATLGLWPRVKALSGWPLSDEDDVRALAEDWRTGSRHFQAAAEFDTGPLATLWPDSAGEMFAGRVRGELGRAAADGDAMVSLADRCDHFAAVVTGLKTTIRDLIEANLPRYAATGAMPPEDREAVRADFVEILAEDVNRLLRDGTEQIGGPAAVALPPPAPPPPPAAGPDPLAVAGAVAVNGAASLGNAVLQNPGLVVAAAGGAALTVLSSAGVAAGATLSVTGVGTLAGGPLVALSAAGLATGTATTGIALAAIAEHAAGDDRVTPVQVGSEPAEDAGGATADEKIARGQQVDGRKLPIEGGPPDGVLYRRNAGTGEILNYAEYDSDGYVVKRVDLAGHSHKVPDAEAENGVREVEVPHVAYYDHHVNPYTGKVHPQERKTEVRPAEPHEVPS